MTAKSNRVAWQCDTVVHEDTSKLSDMSLLLSSKEQEQNAAENQRAATVFF